MNTSFMSYEFSKDTRRQTQLHHHLLMGTRQKRLELMSDQSSAFSLHLIHLFSTSHFCCSSSHVSLVTATATFFNQVLGNVICVPVPNLVALASTLLISHLRLFNCHQSPILIGLALVHYNTLDYRASRFYISYISDISGII